MRRSFAKAVITGTAVAAAVLLGAGTASAATFNPSSWLINPSGGTIGATAGTTVLTNTANGVQLTCTSSSVTGGQLQPSPVNGSPTTDELLATLSAGSVGFANCSGPFGLTFNVTHNGTWNLYGVNYDDVAHVTTGRIDNISATLDGLGCHADVTGSANATYDNDTGELRVIPDPTLVIGPVDPNNDCFGLMNDGDVATFDGLYTLTSSVSIVGQP